MGPALDPEQRFVAAALAADRPRPLGWARYFGQRQLIGLIEPVTAAEEPAAGHGSVP